MKTKIAIGLTILLLAAVGAACGNDPSSETTPPSAQAVEDAAQPRQNPPSEGSDQEPERGDAVAEYHKITATEAQKLILESDRFVLLDVRTEEEFRENRIDGAILIPDYEVKERAETELPDQDALILVYCRSGRRSAEAANALVDMGYTGVYDFGGIIDWPYDTISG